MSQLFKFPAQRMMPVAILCVPFYATEAGAELYFNVNALDLNEEQKSQIDLNILSRTDIQMPGTYEVSVRVNRQDVGRHSFTFVECGNTLCPELTLPFLREQGVKVGAIPGLKTLGDSDVITQIADVLPDADAQFDFDKAVLNLSIPQAAIDNGARGYIPPEQWDDGLPMLFASYSASGAETRNRRTGGQESTQYVNLRSGANYGPWRLRNNSYYQRNDNINQWKTLQSWLERDIRSLRSRLVMGETSSPGLIYDSFSFRGVSLASQDSMLPDSMQGYAPQITGVAITNATVEVRQNGNLLYQTYVSPGEFVINDLYATSTSGDFEITIREEDGTVRTYTQSFASPPVSIRKGALKYSLTAGEFGSRYYNRDDTLAQRFGQAEFLYGVLNNTSLYSGLIAAEHYRSGMLGIGQGLGMLGAVSIDVTHAETRFDSGEKLTGQSWRARYSKRFDTTGTSMTLAGYRYATDGYYEFDEASNSYFTNKRNNHSVLKSRAQLNLSQNIGPFGSVSLSANQLEYWGGSDTRSRSIVGSWSKTFNGGSVNLNQSQNKSWRTGKTDHVTSASVSLPLGKWLFGNSSSVRMSNSFTRSDTGSSSLNSTLSGTALEGRNLSWSVSQARSEQASGKTSNSTALSGTYQGGLATVNLGYSDFYGESQRMNWGVQGAAVLHPYGVTLSPPLSEGSSYALVRAPGARNVKVQNKTGLSTDSKGYAVVPSMMAYRENRITLDTSTLGEDVDLTQPVKKVVPTREALVLADYETSVGYRTLLTLTHKGQSVPFGATVSAGESSGITGDGGQVYLAGLADGAKLSVILPGGKSCNSSFKLSDAKKRNGIIMAEMACI
ncbi:fimbrial biogenesis outer membrane usher protein [Enterobacter bugandensis]|uniref:fimbria/pilus outer membrane usher protein n=1 Tax=Enterobacter bugandensis TaxID=881260 RepID=UPI002002E45E|nr:fimbria/pilus outer membrane usher protein [Enterobacter bugandensis]MCK7068198.1 fimbrial biogenesis outer membrane usher protein [Enterobacter bugandensis]